MKHSFILDKPKSTEATFVFMMCTCADGRLKYPLKEKVLPADWKGAGTSKKSIVNIKIAKINQHLVNVNLNKANNGQRVLKDKLRRELDELLGASKVETKKDFGFFEQWQSITEERENGVELTKEGKRFSGDTIKSYNVTKGILETWETKLEYKLNMQDFDMDSYRLLYAYLTNDLKFALNTVGSRLKHMKAFLRAGHKRRWHTNMVYADPDFLVPSEQTPDIHLSVKELELLAAQELTGAYRTARDWFLVEAFTSLRISDTKRLKLLNITGKQITISNEKTDEVVVLPIHPILAKVLADNENNWPPKIADQTINDYIKLIAKDAGLSKTVLYSHTKGGKRVDTYYEKWEMITNHTGRRSFITNMSRSGAPDNVTMKLSGIKKIETLRRYNKLSAAEIAEQAAELPFFK